VTKTALHDLPMWVVTKNPSDFPGLFVARLNVWNDDADEYLPTAEVIVRENYEDMWTVMTTEKGLSFVPRYETDAEIVLGVFL
jgi:hypothetical protein